MNNNKKQKGNWYLLIIGVVLSSVITSGVFRISASDFDQAKNLKWEDWTNRSLVNASAVIAEDSGHNNHQPPSEQKTWDYWLKYVVDLVSKLAIPILIFGFGLWFQKREREKAQNNLSEEAIQTYLKIMADILLEQENRKMLFPDDKDNPDDTSVREVVRSLTVTILRRLEGNSEYQRRIIDFLRDTELFNFIFEKAYMRGINLSKTGLWGAYLKEAKLKGASFEKADLWAADLRRAELYNVNFQGGANLGRVQLQKAVLGGADLRRARLEQVNFQGASLKGADLRKAILKKALYNQDTDFKDVKGDIPYENMYKIAPNEKLNGADLIHANLKGADLKGADLSHANLKGANLNSANLKGADLSHANLKGANLKGADLSHANLKGANLKGADLSNTQIKLACLWEEAIYKGDWHWDKKIKAWIADNEQAKQDNTKYIEDLKKDKSSDLKEPSNCKQVDKIN